MIVSNILLTENTKMQNRSLKNLARPNKAAKHVFQQSELTDFNVGLLVCLTKERFWETLD